MRILIAPDKFKGSLTAAEAATAIKRGVTRAISDADCLIIPVSDGGEGLIEATNNTNAERRVTRVRGPLGDEHNARWALLTTPSPGNPPLHHIQPEHPSPIAVIEMAEASGLGWVTPSPETAVRADSYGTGQLIQAALDAGARTIMCGIGGSACTDGGSGALRALGARILDRHGNDIPPGGGGLVYAHTIDTSAMAPVDHVRIILATDVTNPLLGPHGAAAVYAPQKGAGPHQVATLEQGLTCWSTCLTRVNADFNPAAMGMGAAGGFASALTTICSAITTPGFDTVATLTGFDAALAAGVDLLIVGEGTLDHQTLSGKAPVAAARRAAAWGIPTVAVAGAVNVDTSDLEEAGMSAVIALRDVSSGAGDKDDTMRHAAEYLEQAAEKLVRDMC
ncbi:glycerate kinase [Corynebacterium kroppenstedtii]|uniref:glycerate kinase n=1 Tax=Corynebacterium sp. PCR 32 TaxID=3351342 RepID=UPI0030ABDB03